MSDSDSGGSDSGDSSGSDSSGPSTSSDIASSPNDTQTGPGNTGLFYSSQVGMSDSDDQPQTRRKKNTPPNHVTDDDLRQVP